MKLLMPVSATRPPLSPARLRYMADRVVRRVKGSAFASRAEASLIFVGAARMRTLNRKYRRQDRPTDVLSFPLMEGCRFPAPPRGPRVLGDVVLCTPVATRQARENGIPVSEEVARLFVHGLLHLLGYDHAVPAQEKKMFALQERFLGRREGGRRK